MLFVLGTSCKKFVDVPLPQDKIVADKVFSNDQTATSAVLGLYSNSANSNMTVLNGALSVYCSLSADDLYNVSPNANYDAFTTNSLIPTSAPVYNSFWSASYKNIYQANAVLEDLKKSTELTDSLRLQLESEVLFLRSLNYFYLVNLFGDVPLLLSTDYTINDTMSRTASAKVYDQIISDLQEAMSHIQAAYVVNSSFPKERIRANKWSLAALLARVKLYTGEYAKAEELASDVISSGLYSLDTVSNVFMANSKEAIFQLQSTNKNTAEGAAFIPPSGVVPVFAVTPSLMNIFDSNDRRKDQWLSSYSASSGGPVYYYPYKYKIRSSTIVTEYNTVLRLAEQYLIRAEARAQQDNLDGARQDVNAIRIRAGLLPLPDSVSKAELLSAIERERRTEFFAEWGHRWLDLKRTGRADSELSALKGSNWQNTDQWYPIPLSEIQLNPFLSQNSGY